jgi:hypothetical protein
MIKGSSLFSQLLHHFPRTEFANLVVKLQAERRSKGLPEECLVICQKWLALRPEERWWLYSKTASEAGRMNRPGVAGARPFIAPYQMGRVLLCHPERNL